MRYFFDTYALIEIAKNNPDYIDYSGSVVITTIFNLAELYYIILKDFGEERAKTVYYKFKECVNEVSDDVIFEAMKFRKQHKHKNLSYADCIGYCLALQHNLKFLTGDKEFKNFDNVEFVQ